MKYGRLDWAAPEGLAKRVRQWSSSERPEIDLTEIERAVAERGDPALLELTERFDAPEAESLSLRVGLDEARAALSGLDPAIRRALDIAIENVGAVARAQLFDEVTVSLPQGHRVSVGEAAVASAAVYAPGGRASYPSTVVMGCVVAKVAGVERVVLVSPPGPKGRIYPVTLAAAALCGADEVYAVGGAQAIFALARGTRTIRPVEVIAGPGNAWVQAAKRRVFGEVGIDSLAGPSDLTVVFDARTDLRLAALDLCAQAEHGAESPLVAIAVNGGDLDALTEEIDRIAGENESVNDCRVALLEAPDAAAAVALVNELAPEHLQLMDPASAGLASEIRTAGCVFAGPEAATAFGDYVCGSNHILPTDGTGRMFGPVSPATFRRRTSRVSLTPESAAELASPLSALADAEGLPVHGLSAMARKEDEQNRDS